MSSNFLSLSLILYKAEFLVFVLPQTCSKLNNTAIHLPNNVIFAHVASARNLGVIFDELFYLYKHNSAVSKSCSTRFHNYLCYLRCIRNTVDQTAVCTTATSLIESKLTIVKLTIKVSE